MHLVFFSAILDKEDNFCDFLFVSLLIFWKKKQTKKKKKKPGSTLKAKEFAPKGDGRKTILTDLLPLKVYPSLQISNVPSGKGTQVYRGKSMTQIRKITDQPFYARVEKVWSL